MTERENYITKEEKEALIEDLDEFFGQYIDKDKDQPEQAVRTHPKIESSSDNLEELSLQEQFNHVVLFHSRSKPNEPIDIREIALQTGISRQSAYRYYNQLREVEEGIPVTKRRAAKENIAHEKQNIIDMRAAGIKPKIISEVTGASYNTVSSVTIDARDEGQEFPPLLEPFDLITEEIFALKKQGMKNAEVARRLELDPVKVGNKADHMVRTGRILKERNRRSPEVLAELDEKIRQLMDEGLGNAEIAEQLGESLFSVMNSKTRIRRKKIPD